MVWTGTEIVMVYTDETTGLYAQRFAPTSGARIGPRTTILTGIVGINRPRLVWNCNGFGLAWTDKRTGVNQNYFTRLDATAARIRGQNNIALTAGEQATAVTLAWTGAGYYLAWQEAFGGVTQTMVAAIDLSGAITYGPTLVGPAISEGPAIAWTGTRLGIGYSVPSATVSDMVFALVSCP